MEKKVKIELQHSSDDFKVLNLKGQAGEVLKKHKVDHNALLLVGTGTIIYQEDGQAAKTLSEGNCQSIPANVFHEVICQDTAQCFVVLSNRAKLRFQI